MVEDLIRRARRRLIVNETLSQSALACAFAVGGVALILILGTRYLEWWTLTLFAALGLGIGIARIWRALPSEYATAVRVDSSAGLHDALSTAFYFSARDSGSPEFQKFQLRQAEAVAGTVQLDAAVPFTFPRALYAMAALAVLATGLVFFRYNSTKGLDLRAPLTEVLFEDLAATKQVKKSGMDSAQRQRLETAESLLAKLGVPIKPEDQQSEAALEKAIDQALDNGQTPADKGQKGAPGKSEDGKPASGLDAPPNGDPLDGKDSDKDQNADKSQDGKEGPQNDNNVKKSSNSDSGSLMSKLKDAVNNMMSKAGKENNGGAQKGDQKPNNQASKSDKASGDKGQNSKGQDQQGQSQADAQDGEPSDEQKEGQQAQGKSGSKSSQQSAQAGSGVGSQDGAKDIKAAEQMKAMGKLSEIIGKRSATVTGETTIEVQSGNQTLKTAYTNKAATHGEADSDVSRDEIPVSMQPYVQQYFEQVRKSGAAAAKPKTTAAPAKP